MNYKRFNIVFIFLFLIFAFSSFADAEVFWANRVIEVSSVNSEKNMFGRRSNSKAYAASQILGVPSVMDDAGESVCAWSPQDIKRNDFIIVGFEKKIYAEMLAIHENYNPGAIVRVVLYGRDANGDEQEKIVYNNSNPVPVQKRGRMLYINFEKTPFAVEKVRIDINTFQYNDTYQIDAVAIADKYENVAVKINLSSDTDEMGEPENLGRNVNSTASELAPVISPDGNTLFFTRQGHPDQIGVQNIWYATKNKQGNFDKAKNIGEPLNTKYHNFAISILPDGNSMLVGNEYKIDTSVSQKVSIINGKMSREIDTNIGVNISNGFSMTYRKGDTWSFPTPVRVRNFYNTSAGSYCLASNGQVLLLSIQQEGGEGETDLYVSFLMDDKTWSAPKNLGPDINTPAREDSPFLSADGKTLFFSTAGKPGYGSSDIFMTKRLDDTWLKWSVPVNLGPKINTKGWDAYFTITANGDYAYFVSSQNSVGNEDIFRVKMAQSFKPEKTIFIVGTVKDKKTNKPVDATIYYENLSNGEKLGNARSNPKNGEYKLALVVGYKYGIHAEAENYISVNENIDLTQISEKTTEITKNLFLVPIEKGISFDMKNLFFAFNSFELLPESEPELNRLAKFMEDNPNITILLDGHTDNIGSNASNYKLSVNRVNAVKDYLVSKEIVANRITTKGNGATKPLASNDTEEGRAQNRRVECTILTK